LAGVRGGCTTTKTSYEMLKGGTKGGEMEGLRCFEEEQAW